MKNKFYDIKNKVEDRIDIYVYGQIIGGSMKWDEADVTFKDFKDALENVTGKETVNLYINSGGGSVFTTQGIVAMLQRAKTKGITINAYIDGLGASCASFLPMLADNIYTYNSSILMLHKPMSVVYGNSNDMLEQINILDKIENSVMLPLYMSKAKEGVTEEQIKEMLSAETWLDATEMSDIFNITILDTEKELVACVDKDILSQYKNTPQAIKDLVEKIDTIKPNNATTIEDVITAESNRLITEKLKNLKAKLELELI